jgi:hypothetical protein
MEFLKINGTLGILVAEKDLTRLSLPKITTSNSGTLSPQKIPLPQNVIGHICGFGDFD